MSSIPNKLYQFIQPLMDQAISVTMSIQKYGKNHFFFTGILIQVFLVPIEGMVQDQAKIDSLVKIINGSSEDTVKIKDLINLGDLYKSNVPDTALIYYEQALEISEHLGLPTYQAISKRSIGMIKENQGMYEEALEEYFLALAFFEDMGNKQGIAACYNDIAIIHYMQESPELCMKYLTKSFEFKKELGDTLGMANYYSNMSALKTSMEAYEEALDFLEKALDLFTKLDDMDGVATVYTNMGTIHYHLNNYLFSLENHLKSVDIYEEMSDNSGLAHSLSNIAGLYLLMADSVALMESQRQNYLNQAVSYGLKAYKLTEELDALYVRNYAANTLMNAYRELGDPWKSLEYSEIYISTRDSLFNEEKTRAIEEMDTKYETEKKQQQIELQKSQLIAKDATIKQQKTLRNALIAGFCAVVIVVLVIVQAYIQKRRANRKIMEQNELISEANEELMQLNEEIRAQKEEIEAQRDHVYNQNKAITDSINYAQRIQSAMLPPETYITELLNENFILYKPRDIVSGDFYWVKQVNQYVVIVAADCTGHGVPGAFMSMLGISYLTEIVQRREITQANQVLNEVRKQIKYSLRQHGDPDEAKDGIDLALCVFDMKNNRMQYSGANNPLYIIKDHNGKPELTEIKADRMPLGYYRGKDISFTNHEIEFELGDTFYLFSDGFIDQKGGKDNKRLMSKGFKSLLLEIQDHSMKEQKGILNKALSDWMGSNSQTDDILIIGVRV